MMLHSSGSGHVRQPARSSVPTEIRSDYDRLPALQAERAKAAASQSGIDSAELEDEELSLITYLPCGGEIQ